MIIKTKYRIQKKLKKILNKAFNQLETLYSYFLKPLLSNKYRQIIICAIPRSGTSLAFNLVNSLAVDMESKVPTKGKIKGNGTQKGLSKETSSLNYLMKPGNFITKLPDDIFNLTKIYQKNILKKDILVI